MQRRRTLGALVGASLVTVMLASPVAAHHTYGVLDCGSAGTYEVEAASIEPLPRFESPVPWSGLFLLEDTNRVFRAFSMRRHAGRSSSKRRTGIHWPRWNAR